VEEAPYAPISIKTRPISHPLRSYETCRLLTCTFYCSPLPQVSLGHMACVVGDGTSASLSSSSKEEEALSAATDTITFLYTLEEGSSPRSFGVNVARLAKLPQEVHYLLVNAEVTWWCTSENLHHNFSIRFLPRFSSKHFPSSIP